MYSKVTEPVYQTTPRVPIRSSMQMPDGKVLRVPISPSAPDAFTIIGTIQFVMEQFGRDNRLREKALSIISSRINNDTERNARALLSWVVNRVVYLADPDGGELLQTPIYLLDQIEKNGRAYGDCDDHVLLLGSLLLSIGIPARVAGVKIGGAPNYNHVVVEYLSNSRRVLVDPCAKATSQSFYRERLVSQSF